MDSFLGHSRVFWGCMLSTVYHTVRFRAGRQISLQARPARACAASCCVTRKRAPEPPPPPPPPPNPQQGAKAAAATATTRRRTRHSRAPEQARVGPGLQTLEK